MSRWSEKDAIPYALFQLIGIVAVFQLWGFWAGCLGIGIMSWVDEIVRKLE